MIDRENKKIINGFGTIGVSTDGGIKLILNYIKPPEEIGNSFPNNSEVLDTIEFLLTANEWNKLRMDLKNVSSENSKVYLRDWELNFDNYNIKSIEVFIGKLHRMIYIMALAS